jgi:hypothetical protein
LVEISLDLEKLSFLACSISFYMNLFFIFSQGHGEDDDFLETQYEEDEDEGDEDDEGEDLSSGHDSEEEPHRPLAIAHDLGK